MSGVNIEYKGESIATIPDTGSKTIKTQGKYCEGDILIEYEAPQPLLESVTITPTAQQQTITPTAPYIGFDSVTVEAAEGNTLNMLYADTLVTANIPDAVTIINSMFLAKRSLVSVIMPNVVSIGNYSFTGTGS